MTEFVHVLSAFVLAGAAMYGLGVPLAWLLPAPRNAQWVYRIAVGPLLAIVVAMGIGSLLSLVGIPLHPALLLGMVIVAVSLSWRRMSRSLRSRAVAQGNAPLVMMVGTSLGLWGVSLSGYGLYLPNRDFKNHAYFVAQVAFNRTVDPSVVLRPTPLSPKSDGAFYPLGLHSLLGWVAPTTDWNTVGITAASAILLTAISLPLAGVALARQWSPSNSALPLLTGFALVAFPGTTASFGIGSVVLLAVAALYAAGLAVLLLWVTEPSVSATVSLGLAGVGLLVLHVAEAWGLLLVATACFPLVWAQWRVRLDTRGWLVIGVSGGLAIAIGVAFVRRGLDFLVNGYTDIEPNTLSWPEVLARAFLYQPGGIIALSLVWMIVTAIGVVAAHREGLSPILSIALLATVVIAIVASGTAVPATVNLLTSPWYGSTSRVYLMAGAPIALLGSLGLIAICRATRRHLPEAAIPVERVAGVMGLALLLALISLPTVEARRGELAASLAGAGDTPEIGKKIASELHADETVMTFEGDGTAMLFAANRLPVLSGWTDWEGTLAGGRDYKWLSASLMRLDDPEVAEAMADLRIRYLAIGTTSLYWDQQLGYDIEALLDQPELSLAWQGSDMMILEYQGES